MSDKSFQLAEDLRQGRLSFGRMDNCNFHLPLNPNPICLPFSQLFLFPEAAGGKGPFAAARYLTRPGFLGAGISRDEKSELASADRFLTAIRSGTPINADIAKGKIPDPEKNGNLSAKKSLLVARGFLSENLKLADGELQKAYKEFVKSSLEQHMRPIVKAAKAAGVQLTADDFLNPISTSAKTKVREWLFPGFFHPFPAAHPKVALVARYEQCWEPAGYTRGDLVNSFSLAPGEQLTLEYHYWDKSTVKSEEELAQETELKVSSSLTQRDSTELLSELFSELGTKVDGGVNLTIPIPAGEVPIPVGVDFNSEVAGKVGTKLQGTAQSSTEKVVEASNTFKQTHRVRVEITRETGSESKQTRVIVNTNRCHTLNCAYFEVLANYVLSVSFVGIEPCLLVGFDKPKINRNFVLCYEHILKKVLLDRLFLAGFDAAKKLEAQRFFSLLKRVRDKAQARQSGRGAALIAGSALAGDSATDGLQRYVSNIVRDFDEVKGDAESILNGIEDEEPQDIGPAILRAVEKYRRLLYWAVLNLNSNAVNALKNLKGAQTDSLPAREALADFFAIVTSRDYEDNVVIATVEKGLDALGIPRPIVDALMLLHKVNFVSLADDDAGLAASVRAAEEAFTNSLPALPGVGTPGGLTPVPGQPGPTEPASDEGFSLQELAEAKVELERLLCHLKKNEAHYMQAVFQSTHPDQRLAILRAKGLDAIVRNEIVGFFDDHALFPLVDMQSLVDLFKASSKMRVSARDLEKFVADIGGKIEKTAKPRLVTIPTPATLMEATVGECDACEEFIQKSRVIDLRQQEAKAALEEAKARVEAAEAGRREQRLAGQPPDLTDPVDRSPASIVVDLNTKVEP